MAQETATAGINWKSRKVWWKSFTRDFGWKKEKNWTEENKIRSCESTIDGVRKSKGGRKKERKAVESDRV